MPSYSICFNKAYQKYEGILFKSNSCCLIEFEVPCYYVCKRDLYHQHSILVSFAYDTCIIGLRYK